MAQHELTFVITTDRELTKDQVAIFGRDMASQLLSARGRRRRFGGNEHDRVESVRFREFNWNSAQYVGQGESLEWAVTQNERDEWASDHEDEEDEDDY